MQATLPLLIDSDFPAIQRADLETLQVNLGYKCNQSCLHCHVNAGPKRTEVMTWETIKQLLTFIESSSVKTLDLTGGAPELNPYFRDFVSAARQQGLDVIDRCNLTVLFEPDQQDTDTLPPYDRLDPILTAYVEEDKSVEQIIAMGFDQQVVERAAQLVDTSEYKRRQAPPGIKITPRAFGRDRRLPITNWFKG